MDTITWPVAALAIATIALVLSNIGNEIRRRRKFKRYCEKVVAELSIVGRVKEPDPRSERRFASPVNGPSKLDF